MTEDEDYDALSQKQLASIKRDMRISLEDAAVRATHKVMAEFEVLTRPEQQAEPVCPNCKAAVLYECVACSSNNYPPQQQAEPVAFYDFNKGFYWAKPTKIVAPTVVDVPPIPLYTTAAQREWVGLTPEEVLDMFDVNNVYGSKWIAFARTVEAALRSKNK